MDASKPRLDAAFRAAEKAHEPESSRILARLAELHDSFDALEIGYGERFKSQFLQYLPAYLQAGGKAGPAVDDLLARKVLYRLPDPSEADQSAVENLELELRRLWRDLKLDASPVHSLGRISKAKKAAL